MSLQDVCGNQCAQDEMPVAATFDRLTRGPGRAVPYQAEMEHRFGTSFGSVRAWVGVRELAASLGGDAFAFGDRVAFADPAPSRETVAHELAHVAQHRGAATGARPHAVSDPGSTAEREADLAATAVSRGETPEIRTSAPPVLHLHGEGLDGGVAAMDAGTRQTHTDGGSPAGPGDLLQRCQEAAGRRDQQCVTLFGQLDAVGRQAFGRNERHVAALCDLALPRTRELLRQCQLPVAVWLRLAGTRITDDPTLIAVLQDARVSSVDGLIAHAAEIPPAFARPLVLGNAVTYGADGPGCARLLADAQALTLLRSAFGGKSCRAALPHVLEAGSVPLLAAYADDRVGQWLTEDALELGAAILGWGAAEAARWVRALAWKPHGRDQLLASIRRNPSGWGGALAGFLNPPTELDAHWLRGAGPANELGNAAIRALSTTNLGVAAQVTGWAGWTLRRFFEQAAGVAIDRAAFERFMAARPAPDLAFELASVREPLVCTTLRAVGYPTDLFRQLATQPHQLATEYGTNIPFADWLDADRARHGALIASLGNHPDWAQAFLKNRRQFRIVFLAGQPGQGPAWKTAVDGVSGLFDRCLDTVTVATQEEYAGLFALIGDAATRTRNQLNRAFLKLFPQTRLLAAGEVPNLRFQSGIPDFTDTSVVPNRVYRIFKRAVSMTPSDRAFASFFDIMRGVPRMSALATHTLQFASQEEFFWHQIGATPGGQARAWAPPVRRPVPTSYAGAGHVVLEATAAGTTQLTSVRAVDGTITTGPPIANQPGDLNQRHVGTDRDGTATAVGGGENRTAAGGTDQRTGPPGRGLRYFQNHAVHEFGHSVGEATYQGMGETGNTFATRYGNWRTETPDQFRASMWTESHSRTYVDPTGSSTSISAYEAAKWMLYVLAKGSEPPGTALTTITDSFGNKVNWVDAEYPHQELAQYFYAVAAGRAIGHVPSMAFQYTGYDPPGDPHLFALRWDNRFATFDRRAYVTCKQRLGWYSMSSPVEMFAEAYTSRYTGGPLPDGLGAGRDFGPFFTRLEASPSILVAAGASSGLAPAALPLAAGEVAPPTSVVPP